MKYTVVLFALAMMFACNASHEETRSERASTGVSIGVGPDECPATGTCNEAFGGRGAGPLVCFGLSALSARGICQGDPDYCNPDAPGSCAGDSACLIGQKEWCPECTEESSCIPLEWCGDLVPAERCVPGSDDYGDGASSNN